MPEKRLKAGKGLVELVQGDITVQEVEAIVNAANTGLRGGGGVDGAIHRAGGPRIMAECREIGYCATGDAVITTGGDLPAKYVIHTVGPVWRGGTCQEAEKLASCYRRSLEVAGENNIRSLAFPSISTGVYGYPVDKAAGIALTTIRDSVQHLDDIEVVRMVLFDRNTYAAYENAFMAMDALGSGA